MKQNKNNQSDNPTNLIPIPLLNWYDHNARILSWRSEPTPYRVWVSEIMLQQTRVEAVKPYFERFMQTFPDPAALANADLQTVYKLWEGLGYYSRAKNLHSAAQRVVSDFAGQIPDQYEELIALPGIGEYTAAAIASIAYNKKYAVVDGNVLRVVSRLMASREDISKAKVKKEFRFMLEQVMPDTRAGDFNQAMMELGATVCVPNGMPLCEKCPLAELCEAKRRNLIEEIPVKPEKKKRRIEEYTILLFVCDNRTAIAKRLGKGLLEGLWGFPMTEGSLEEKQVGKLLESKQVQFDHITPLQPAKHIFTHVEWHMKGYLIEITKFYDVFDSDSLVWTDAEGLEKTFPIPNAFSVYNKIIKQYLNEQTDNIK
ncbi:MAG: A/G-specific adenine glycosylase [Anaerofustis sp.]